MRRIISSSCDSRLQLTFGGMLRLRAPTHREGLAWFLQSRRELKFLFIYLTITPQSTYTGNYKFAFLFLVLLVIGKNHDKQMEYTDLLAVGFYFSITSTLFILKPYIPQYPVYPPTKIMVVGCWQFGQ